MTEGPITVDRTAVIEREGRKMTGVVEETVELAPGVTEEELRAATEATLV